jgi:hypothetical protein
MLVAGKENPCGSISPLTSVGITDVVPHSTAFVVFSEGCTTVLVELEVLGAVLCELGLV